MRPAIDYIKTTNMKPAEVAYKAKGNTSTLYIIPKTYEVLDKIAAALNAPLEIVFDIERKSPIE